MSASEQYILSKFNYCIINLVSFRFPVFISNMDTMYMPISKNSVLSALSVLFSIPVFNFCPKRLYIE